MSRILFTGGVCPIACWDTPPPEPEAGTPQGPEAGTPPPRKVHAGRYGQQAGGTHPTGMQSCYLCKRSYGKVMFSVWLASGRYAFYWNAFLLHGFLFPYEIKLEPCQNIREHFHFCFHFRLMWISLYSDRPPTHIWVLHCFTVWGWKPVGWRYLTCTISSLGLGPTQLRWQHLPLFTITMSHSLLFDTAHDTNAKFWTFKLRASFTELVKFVGQWSGGGG